MHNTIIAKQLKVALARDGWNVRGVTIKDLQVLIACCQNAAKEAAKEGCTYEDCQACYSLVHETQLYHERGAVYCGALEVMARL